MEFLIASQALRLNSRIGLKDIKHNTIPIYHFVRTYDKYQNLKLPVWQHYYRKRLHQNQQ